MKRYFFGILAVILAVGFSAFTVKKQAPVYSGEKWFVFNGVDPTDLNDPTKYTLDGDGSNPTVCTSTTLMYRCEIKALPQSGDPDHPDLSTIISQRKRSTP